MPAAPRRKRLQVHLSTAVVMMFVAGALIWANSISHNGLLKRVREGDGSLYYYRYYGWPCDAFYQTYFDDDKEPKAWIPGKILTSGFILDTMIALAMLIVCWIFCEWLICRRAARKVS